MIQKQQRKDYILGGYMPWIMIVEGKLGLTLDHTASPHLWELLAGETKDCVCDLKISTFIPWIDCEYIVSAQQ